MTTATCAHPRPEKETDEMKALPCAWPGCPDGTPKDRIAMMEGTQGTLRMKAGVRYEVAADGGVTLWERVRSGDGWGWRRAIG